MAEWENYLNTYNIEFERKKGKKGHVLALLFANFPIDDLECQQDNEIEEMSTVEPLLEILSASPDVVEPPYLQKRASPEELIESPHGNESHSLNLVD